MSSVFMDGVFDEQPLNWREAAEQEALNRGGDHDAIRAWGDRAVYHPDNPADYGSTVGIMDKDGNTFCVGCHWCEGPRTEAHSWVEGGNG